MTDTTTDDHDLYARQGIGSQIGFGEHPAVIVVDYQLAFTRGLAGGRLPGGRAALDGAHRARRARARRARRPTRTAPTSRISPTPGRSASSAPGSWPARAGTDGCEIDPLVAPEPGDVVFEKQSRRRSSAPTCTSG